MKDRRVHASEPVILNKCVVNSESAVTFEVSIVIK